MSRRRVVILGLGNPDCGDDGVGAAVARAATRRVAAAHVAGGDLAGVEVHAVAGDAASLLLLFQDADAALVVDASAPAGAPGRLRRLDVSAVPAAVDLRAASSHRFGPAQAIELARALGSLPPRTVVWAVEGERFDPGAPLSAAVAAVVDTVAARVVDEAGAVLRAAHGEAGCTNGR